MSEKNKFHNGGFMDIEKNKRYYFETAKIVVPLGLDGVLCGIIGILVLPAIMIFSVVLFLFWMCLFKYICRFFYTFTILKWDEKQQKNMQVKLFPRILQIDPWE